MSQSIPDLLMKTIPVMVAGLAWVVFFIAAVADRLDRKTREPLDLFTAPILGAVFFGVAAAGVGAVIALLLTIGRVLGP